MKRYLNPSQRRKSIKVWVSDEERALVELKHIIMVIGGLHHISGMQQFMKE